MLTTLLALPMQTAAHDQIGVEPEGARQEWDEDWRLGHQFEPNPIPQEIINWIHIYKNPLTVAVTDLSYLTHAGGGLTLVEHGGAPAIYDFDPEGFTERDTYLMPSYNGQTGQDIYWVKVNAATGELYPDPAKEGNSGWITADSHTSVGLGDIVAIAVNINGWGGRCTADLAIGPKQPIPPDQGFWTHSKIPGVKVPIIRDEGKWRLNANMPLLHHEGAFVKYQGGYITPHVPRHSAEETLHTLVYQFVVEEEHLALNDDGAWLKQTWVTPSEVREITHTTVDWTTDSVAGKTYKYRQWTAFDWLWGNEDAWAKPTDTTVSVFNTYAYGNKFGEDWGMSSRNANNTGTWGSIKYQSGTRRNRNIANGKYRDYFVTPERADGSHRHIPMYDPALPGKADIFYPKIEAPDSRATTTMNVPEGTQTGEFTVLLRFRDGVIFEGHDYSDEGVEAFKTALTAALADTAWTVVSLTFDEANRPTIASSSANPTSFSEATQYKLTLAPPEGVIDEFPLIIPEDMVFDAGENGNFASAEVMISVDSSLTRELPLAEGGEVEVPEPAAGAYGAGDVIEVLVPFAEDGLTYIGDDPPYLTIYLGAAIAANRRHATWEKGTESAGSTIVPFRYVVHADDPTVDSVRVDAAVLRPKGTTLMNGAGQVWVEGKADPPMAESGKPAPAPTDADAGLSILTDTRAPLPEVEASVRVQPLPLYLPPDESDPKAGLSSVPRSPLVFNELGNGSGDTNDWLELRNVTGDVVSLKEWELSVVQDGKKEDTSLVLFPDVSVPADGLLLITNSDPTAEGNLLAGGDDIATPKVENKGSSHLYLVQSGLSLPDDGQFLLILRNTKEKLGLNEAFVDVAGGGGSGTDAFVREQEGAYDTYVWPLQVLEAPESATEDALSAGKVWLRAKVDIVGYHRDAWGEAAFTGVGYDRNVSKSAETAGTPGYPNGAVKTEAPTPRGAVTISEVMLDSAGGTLPQWIELYNASKTDALNLNRWELEIQNVDSEELVGRPIVRLTLQEKVIQPNQTLLIVTGNARASSENVFPADRVYNLLELHDKNLRIKKPSDTFLSAMGFYLKLTDRNEHLVDEVGNTDGNRRTDDTPAWALPIPLSRVEGMRSSLIRRYDKGVARDGTSRQGWALAANFARFKADGLHYGHADDIGTPGYRQGGALPVELSSFAVTRLESGSVIVTWTTESEVDNAGFNLRRSLTRDGGWLLLNPALIAGAGTTGERQTYTFIDTSAKPGVEHYYQLEEVSFGGKPETLVTRRLRGPVSASHRALKTLGEVKQREE